MAKVIQLPVAELQSKVKAAIKNPARFALPIASSITLEDGKWIDVDGVSTWKVVLTSPGAVTMSFYASHVVMPREGRILVTGKDAPIEEASHLYKRGRLLSSIVRGDVMTVEIVVPTRQKGGVQFFIEEAQMGFKGILKGTGDHPIYSKLKGAKDLLDGINNSTANAGSPSPRTQQASGNGGTPPPSGAGTPPEACYRNFTCFKDGLNSDIGDATVSIIYSNFATCTGALVHDASKSFKNFVLTAKHCSDGIEASNRGLVRFTWKGEADCGSPAFYNSVQSPYTTQDATERVRFGDQVLLEALDPPPPGSTPYWLGFDAGEAGKSCSTGGEGSTGSDRRNCVIAPENKLHLIHHASDLPRQYAFGNGSFVSGANFYRDGTTAAWLVSHRWDTTGAPSQGSSGSSLVIGTRTIGVLSFIRGPSDGSGGDNFGACSATYMGVRESGSDRLMDSWLGGSTQATSVKAWLDPSNTGVLVQDGSRPTVTAVTPTVALNLDRSSVNPGQSATLTNRATNAASCELNSVFTGLVSMPVDGGRQIDVPSPTSPGSYPLAVECTSSTGNKASRSISLTVTAPPPQAPAVSFSLSRTSAAPGDVVVGSVSSSNATSCTLTSPITASMSLPVNGNANITLNSNAPNGNYDLTATCVSSTGQSASDAANITVSAPTAPPPSGGQGTPALSVSLDRASAAPGSTIVVSVTSVNASSCTLTSPITATTSVLPNGSQNVLVNSNAAAGNYNLQVACSNGSGLTASDSESLNISGPNPPAQPTIPVTVSLDRQSVTPGALIRVSVTSSGASACTVSSPVLPTTNVPTNGGTNISVLQAAQAGTFEVRVSCTNSAGQTGFGATPITISLPLSGSVGVATGGSGGGGAFGAIALLGIALIRRLRKAAASM